MGRPLHFHCPTSFKIVWLSLFFLSSQLVYFLQSSEIFTLEQTHFVPVTSEWMQMENIAFNVPTDDVQAEDAARTTRRWSFSPTVSLRHKYRDDDVKHSAFFFQPEPVPWEMERLGLFCYQRLFDGPVEALRRGEWQVELSHEKQYDLTDIILNNGRHDVCNGHTHGHSFTFLELDTSFTNTLPTAYWYISPTRHLIYRSRSRINRV